MKKGFTMIELVFVIVILGILASVAVPRLAGTKADAEISAAVANMRTLVSDATAYYVAKGGFEAAGEGGAISTTWSQITNVPVDKPNNTLGNNTSLNVGGKRCIDFLITKATDTTPAYIIFAKYTRDIDTVCRQVQNSPSLEHYFNSRVPNLKPPHPQKGKGYMAIGSSISIYDE
ncbi:MAG: type II secretion system protein [Campylobacter sp.]|nr:type II secretion system protein [Campylobacter sp.]